MQLYFFGPKVSNFFTNITFGIKEDSKIENVMLHRYNDVFFPSNSYYNSDPLPEEWIEIFEDLGQ